ncbi:MAG: hypothetical protein E7319_03480 [Clostridiales bacterium]|nr:hypothetical protein [Clostridiales bacterium]
MKKKKSLIMLVCALMIVSSVAFGTIAYLTDRAGVTNKFTIGNVDIVVDETEVDENGDPIPDPEYDPEDPEHPDPNKRTEEENEYPLLPGSEYVKDPTMTVKAGSEEAYVRMVVTITNAAEIDAIFAELQSQYPEKYPNGFVPGDFVTGRDNTEWVYTGTMEKNEELNTYTLEFRYFEAVEPTSTENAVLPALFETIKIPGELTNAHLTQLTDFAIDVNGHAIQTTGFADEAEAWAAFDAQMTVTNTTDAHP